MQKLSKFVLFLFLVVSLLATYYMLHATTISAQVPEILLSCSETRPNEFHSLRPYQAAPCGGAPQALFCSNKLVIFEDFELAHRCQKYRKYQTGTVQCDPNYHVDAHNLNITLDESEFPIVGNTQDEFDDAQKLNEYASWYLNGVVDKRENENPTDSQIVDFSGPVRKLVPSMIQDAQRIKTLESATNISTDTTQPTNPLEEDDTAQGEPENHDQLVIGDKRLTSWSIGTISIPRAFSNMAQNFLSKIPGVGDTFSQYITPAWNNRFPPLPWTTIGGKQLTELEYKKYYNEWLGKSCIIIPFLNSLFCFDNPGVTNEYADLWHFVPLSNNSDKKGKNYLLTGDGPNYVPSQGTEIEDAQHKSYLNAPLYFAHTQEVKDLSELLNQTYQPSGYKAEKLSETVETLPKNEFGLNCSAVNVRVNEGDDLFPGDRPSGKELYVEGAEYDITNVECDEVYERVEVKCKDLKIKGPCYDFEDSFVCNAEVGIEFKLGTQTPFANEIFADTVADSGSTFRKIFPKVEEGAPVECIADIPTVTNVTYSIDNPLNQEPNGGSQTFKQTIYPADGGNSETQLTFPHIGSVYEYFLKGIQTALRPKGYGEPIANGNCEPSEEEPETGACKQWLLDEKVYNKVIAKAASTKCNGKSLNPFWAIGIGLNENGGLMTDIADGSSSSHFGCNVSQVQSIDEKIDCMVNTLRNDCLAGKTDEATLQEYGYLPGYELGPIRVLDPGGVYPPPLFGSGFNISQLVANLNNTDWRAYYAPKAPIFCPSSPVLESKK